MALVLRPSGLWTAAAVRGREKLYTHAAVTMVTIGTAAWYEEAEREIFLLEEAKRSTTASEPSPKSAVKGPKKT